jgi:hypothetical protein
MWISTMMAPYIDGGGNMISPVSQVDININASSFQANSGNGIVEDLNGMDTPEGGSAPPWTWNGPTRTTLWYNVTMTDSQVLENQGGGWVVTPNEGWVNADQVIARDVSGSLFTDNRGPAFHLEANHDLRGGGSASETNTLTTCRILDNSYGVAIDLGYDNFGYFGETHINDCRITDNDNEAIMVDGPWSTDGIFRWGYSRVLGYMCYVDDCQINSRVVFNMLGADDSGRSDWDAFMGLQFTNNNVDIDEEVTQFHLGAYPNCDDFSAWTDIGNNRFFRGFIDNGIHLEMFGGMNLVMDATIHDQVIDTPVGSGVNIVAGTLVSSSNPHQIGGNVMVDNVTVEDAGSNGINFTVMHREWIGAKSLAVLEVHDMYMENVDFGIVANDARGAIYNTQIIEPRSPAVNLVYSTFDFYSCDVGPVDTSNIIVRTKGAARLWYDLGVDVKWASGNRVIGAVVSVQDNTWSTIAVNTVVNDEVLPIGYVNSYTVLPDSVYSKSPFLLTGTYLGLTTEKMVDVQGNIVVDLVLVDDVLPRLTVNTPLDGSAQRETGLVVKGHAWDQHSGLKEVVVSIDDGFNWYAATGEPSFEYTFEEVPEGNLMLMVKAVDEAGNERMEIISMLVDATPPPIIVIEPQNDVILTQDPVLNIVGVTERGATVLVNNEQVSLDLTLFRTSIDLMEGMNEIRIVALDRLGNSAVHVISVELDTIAPPLIVTSPMTGEVLGDRSVHVTGQTEDGARVYVNGDMAANQMGDFAHTSVLTEGPNVILVTSEDLAGNRATILVEVTVDTAAPWLELASPASGDVFGADGINVVGWVEQGSIVKVNDQPVEVMDSHFSVSIMGSEGRNIIVVSVIDMADNEHSESVEVWFDTTAPTIELWTPMDDTMTTEGTIDVSGMLHWNEERESFRDITLTINGDFAPFAADGEFQIQYELTEGTNPLFIRATDDVGNYMVHTVTVVKDSVAPFLLVEPTPTFDHPTWDKPSTYRGLVYIDGVTEPGALVTVDGAGVEVDDAGRFNVSIVLDPVPEGDKLVQRSILVVATDAAGNSKEETVEVYRLKEEVTDPGFMDYEAPQYWVLFLSIVILVVAILAAAFLWRRIGTSEEEENVDDVCLVSIGDLEEEV